MMPMPGLTPCAFWNSSLVAREHTSLPAAGAAWAVSVVAHTTPASIPGTTIHFHHPRMLTSSPEVSDGRGHPPILLKTHRRTETCLTVDPAKPCLDALPRAQPRPSSPHAHPRPAAADQANRSGGRALLERGLDTSSGLDFVGKRLALQGKTLFLVSFGFYLFLLANMVLVGGAPFVAVVRGPVALGHLCASWTMGLLWLLASRARLSRRSLGALDAISIRRGRRFPVAHDAAG